MKTMLSEKSHGTGRPLRLWPGMTIAALTVAVAFVLPAAAPEARIFGLPSGVLALLGGAVGGLLVALWWLLASRAPWSDRALAVAAMAAAVLLTRPFLHESVAGAGMGLMFYFFALQNLGLALVLWAVASRRLSTGSRRASMFAVLLASCAMWALVRTDGITGEGESQLHWRWSPTPEERLLAEARDEVQVAAPPAAPSPQPPAAAAQPQPVQQTEAAREPAASPATDAPPPLRAPAPEREPEWPGFRGRARDGVVSGVQIETDWTAKPPVEVWRRPVGPGWSSFAVDGDRIYTQEQRGDEEVVSCYRLDSGAPVWRHRDPVRFYESNGGAGPRATPTVRSGRVYTFGATGIVNALDARTGARIWSRNASADADVEVPDWGFASSPLVVDDRVIVAASGRLIAYDAATGAPRWLGPAGGGGYSSPHLVTAGGTPQVVLLRGSRTIGVAPGDGTQLWEHTWQPGVGIVQPAVAPDGDVLITVGDSSGVGMRRLKLARGEGGWTAEERWTSRGLKPYFNDFVVHDGHAYGFDGSILSCIDLQDGARKWKGGRYGHGQLVLLRDQSLLLVLSEDGEVALVGATPDGHRELTRFRAIEGKTWNHPVVVGDLLLVRNGQEMAAFRLPRR